VPTTGEKCDRSGVYRCRCSEHDTTITMTQGEPFPPCGGGAPGEQCHAAVAWQRIADPPPAND